MTNKLEYIKVGNKGRVLTSISRNFSALQDPINAYSDVFRTEINDNLVTVIRLKDGFRAYEFNLTDLEKLSTKYNLVDVTDVSVINSGAIPVFLTDVALRQLLKNVQVKLQNLFPDTIIILDEKQLLVTANVEINQNPDFDLLAPAFHENDGVLVRENFDYNYFKTNFVSNDTLIAYFNQIQADFTTKIREVDENEH